MLRSLITFVPIGQISSELTEASDLKNSLCGDQRKDRERDPEAALIRRNVFMDTHGTRESAWLRDLIDACTQK